jgi:capsule biosynthesis phosphatase
MIIIIPLGGSGTRFKDSGYTKPKALINIFGKPILYYLLDSLNFKKHELDFIYIPYNSEYTDYRLEDKLINDYPNINFKFLKLNKQTEGAAHTIQIALQNIINLEDCSILSIDSDNFYLTDIISLCNGKNSLISVINTSSSPVYSYITHFNNKITDIIEKNKISDIICTGAYSFSSFKQLYKYINYVIENKIKDKNEYYISTIIKTMLNDNVMFENITIDESLWNCIGTPIQLLNFYNNYPKVSCINNKEIIKNKRICFDLDNTLVTFPKVKNDYNTVEPIKKNIDFLNYLKRMGNEIIIYTARRMKTCNGNNGKLLKDIGKITFDTLEKFGINYDEIYFGKPNADFYIDDLAINCFDNIEKTTGFYNNIIQTRFFNKLDLNVIDIYKKSSDDLSGEIYYYKNIPKDIKDLFPLFIDYEYPTTYTIEKIKGTSLSVIYLNGSLTPEIFINVLNSIKRIQNTNLKNETKIDIYENYTKKIKNRYNNYDYSKFNNYEQIYNEITNKLLEYESNNKGKETVIHGDTVFTNIIINNNNKIKFIDMRGKVGDNLTIFGDYLYDWAKIYQSLIGYDKILLNKTVDKNYEELIINTFKNYFISNFSIESFEYLIYITKSLIFSIIPLHDKKNQQLFFDLIKKL